jgi:hypothetical protein
MLRDTDLELVFPTKMLEQLEIERGSHYCVGNGFIVFVNGSEVVQDHRETDTEQILTIPIRQGLNKLEILGTDLLITPPSCVTLGRQYDFVNDLQVEVKSWYDAVVIARDHLTI